VDSTAYLNRIGYAGPLEAAAETLRALHLAHMQTVPFENLDIPLGRPIVLEEAALFDKIVTRRRGGFCYELNGLFAALLRALGFEVDMLAARVSIGNGDFGPDFDHMTLLVKGLEGGSWLADVGFGECFSEPLRFDDQTDQLRDGRAYRLAHGDGMVKLLANQGEDWDDQYLFRLQPYELHDFAAMCLYQQTSPESIFTQKRVCTRITPTGRVTLAGDRMIFTEAGQRREQPVRSEQEYAAALLEHFGIEIS
jgi:N-hydroxyarylamine O-acetyltransferase